MLNTTQCRILKLSKLNSILSIDNFIKFVGFKELTLKKRPEITIDTRKNLTTAFWKLYKRKNIAKINIKEITDLAGYHRATFYMYFTDIYDILKQEKKDLISQFLEFQKTIIPTQSFDEIMKLIAAFYFTNGERLSLLMDSGIDSKFINYFKKTLYPFFLSKWKLPDTIKTTIIYEYAINGLLMAFNCWYKTKSDFSVEEFMKLINMLLVKGIFQTIDRIKSNNL